jgi:hypothetical protein
MALRRPAARKPGIGVSFFFHFGTFALRPQLTHGL